MPQITALACPVCGAPLKPGDEKCSFCGSYIFIKTDLPRLDRHTLNQSVIQDHITDFRRRIRSNQYDEEAHYGLGVAYFSLGLTDEAVDELSQAARLMPENPHIQAQLAVALRNSFKAGNQAAEQQMNTRIQSALLLDPNHVEAAMLKTEVLLDSQKYADAIALYHTMSPEVQDRAKPKFVSAFETLCEQRLGSEKWMEARWCWNTLEPIDTPAAQRLAVRFLNLHAPLVPRTFRNHASSKRVKMSSPGGTGSSSPARILRTMLASIAGLFLGLVQLIVLSQLIPTDENNAVDGWGAFALLFLVLLTLASPFIGALVYRRKSTSPSAVETTPEPVVQPQPGTGAAASASRTSIKRDEILMGTVDMVVIHRVVDVVMEKLGNQEKVRAARQAALNARKK
jgi:hypothetical protein